MDQSKNIVRKNGQHRECVSGHCESTGNAEAIYEALTRAINAEHEPGILVGDFNASIKDGRANYAPPHPQNFTTMADEAFAAFVGQTNGTIVPPAQASWRKPSDGIRSREAKLDFAITYNLARLTDSLSCDLGLPK